MLPIFFWVIALNPIPHDINSSMKLQPSTDLSLHHDSFLYFFMTLQPSPKDPSNEILMQEDDFNNTFINILPSKDEV